MKHYLSNVKQLLIAVIAVLFALPTLAQAQTATTDSQSDDDEVESVVIAGSRIARDSLDSSGTVQVYTAEDIADSGSLTVADFLRSNNGNSFGSFNERSGSAAQSNALISLKGLGSSRTLVLINGKRVVGSPAFGGSAVNINLIPTAAVERIEIILDGAASVYGSDAISGVVNVVLKSDFEGSNLSLASGTARKGGDTSKYSYVSGSKTESGHMTWGVESQQRKEVYDRDRDFTAFYWNDDGDGLLEFFGNEADGISWWARTVQLQQASVAQRECNNPGFSDVDKNASTPDAFNGTCMDTTPGMLLDPSDRYDFATGFQIQAAEGCEEGAFADAGNFRFGYYLDADNNQTACTYEYAAISANLASTKKNSFFLNTVREINDDMKITGAAYFIQNESFGRFAPAAAAWQNFPGTNSLNPWSQSEISQRVAAADEAYAVFDEETNTTSYYLPIVDNMTVAESSYLGRWRWTDLGPRNNMVTDTVSDITLEYDWNINEAFKLNAYIHETRYKSSDRGDYYLDNAGLAIAVENGDDLADPAVADTLKSTTHVDNRVYHSEYGFGLNIDPNVQLGGGDLLIYAGFEAYDVTFISTYDGNSEFGQVGGSAGNSARGGRSATGIFGEVLAPVAPNIDITASFRFDDYDDVGDATSFKFGAAYEVFGGLDLSISVAEGYRAPSLDQLQAATSFSASDATDYNQCFAQAQDKDPNVDLGTIECPERQIDTYFFANPNLTPETSSSLAFTLDFDLDRLAQTGGRLTMSYYQDEITDIIQTASTQDVIWAERFNGDLLSQNGVAIARAHPTYTTGTNPCGAGVQGLVYDNVDFVNDVISFVCTTYVNVGTLSTSGFSLNYGIDFDLGNIGVFGIDLSESNILTFEQEAYINGPVQDTVGWEVTPDVRRTFDVSYDWNDQVTVLLSHAYIGGFAERTDPDDPVLGTLKPSADQISSYEVIDLSVSYDAGQYGKVKLDLSNLKDRDPNLSKAGSFPREYYGLYSIYGRIATISYSLDF